MKPLELLWYLREEFLHGLAVFGMFFDGLLSISFQCQHEVIHQDKAVNQIANEDEYGRTGVAAALDQGLSEQT